jgi:hypothetical protein
MECLRFRTTRLAAPREWTKIGRLPFAHAWFVHLESCRQKKCHCHLLSTIDDDMTINTVIDLIFLLLSTPSRETLVDQYR